MKITQIENTGCYIIERNIFKDYRGENHKTFNSEIFANSGLKDLNFQEVVYNRSYKGVLRGMHWQKSPYDGYKLVHAIQGKVLDVICNINKECKDFGFVFSIELTGDNGRSLFLTKDYCHGMLALTDDVFFGYSTQQPYKQEYDTGIRWDSINFDWGVSGIKNIIVSEKDSKLKGLYEV